MNTLSILCKALGQNGGTIHDCKNDIMKNEKAMQSYLKIFRANAFEITDFETAIEIAQKIKEKIKLKIGLCTDVNGSIIL